MKPAAAAAILAVTYPPAAGYLYLTGHLTPAVAVIVAAAGCAAAVALLLSWR